MAGPKKKFNNNKPTLVFNLQYKNLFITYQQSTILCVHRTEVYLTYGFAFLFQLSDQRKTPRSEFFAPCGLNKHQHKYHTCVHATCIHYLRGLLLIIRFNIDVKQGYNMMYCTVVGPFGSKYLVIALCIWEHLW